MKKFSVSCRVLLVLCLAVVAASCSDDDSDPTVEKSSAKAITSFKFATPAATGAITEGTKTIAVSVPAGTNVTELVPTIAISEKATVTPNTEVKQNFTNAATYTVTAEDGSKQAYVVTVTIAAAEKFTISGISAVEVERGEEFYINGAKFAAASVSEIKLTNIDSKESVTIKASDKSTAARLYFVTPDDLEVGEYSIIVTSNKVSEEVDFTITILPKLPEITGLSAVQVENDDQIIITGKNFSETGNTVYMRSEDGIESSKEIITESATSIEFVVSATPGRRYYIEVETANGDKVESTEVVAVGTLPEVLSINKTTFTAGEKLVITGNGLNVDGLLVGVYYLPQQNGIASQRWASPNKEGTEVSVGLAPAGTYDIEIEVDGNVVKRYSNIVINGL